jgi:hypothetical protein
MAKERIHPGMRPRVAPRAMRTRISRTLRLHCVKHAHFWASCQGSGARGRTSLPDHMSSAAAKSKLGAPGTHGFTI